MQTLNINRHGVMTCEICHRGIMQLKDVHYADPKFAEFYNLRVWTNMQFTCINCGAIMELGYSQEGTYIKKISMPDDEPF